MIKNLDEQQYSTATIGAPLISSAKLQFFRDNAKLSNGYFGTSMGMLEKSRRLFGGTYLREIYRR